MTGAVSHHVPREMAEMVIALSASLRVSCVIFRHTLGSQSAISKLEFLRLVSKMVPIKPLGTNLIIRIRYGYFEGVRVF